MGRPKPLQNYRAAIWAQSSGRCADKICVFISQMICQKNPLSTGMAYMFRYPLMDTPVLRSHLEKPILMNSLLLTGLECTGSIPIPTGVPAHRCMEV